MSGTGDQQAIELAVQAALAARQETFLARYPRKLKLFVTFLLLVGLSFPFWSGGKTPETVVGKGGAVSSPSLYGEAEKALSSTMPATKESGAVVETERSLPLIEPQNEVQKMAVERNDADDPTDPTMRMTAAPDADLAEETLDGYLPKIGKDGRKPWQTYARPFDRMDPRPRIALVVGDLGLSRVATDAALRRLPPDVTLAFDAQSDAVGNWLERARHDGHETLLSLPMEPLDYPRSDPGPDTLLTALPNADNLQRFLSFLKRGVGYVGVTTLSGSRFVADMDKVEPIMDTLHARGLLVLDPHNSARSVIKDIAKKIHVPVAVSLRAIDSNPTPQAIDAALTQLEQTARIEGEVVAMASPLPITLERIEKWAQGLSSRGFVLAPLSAVVE